MLNGLRTFFVKEHVGFLKLADVYDILDPGTQAQVAIAKEEPPAWAKYLRLVVNKTLLPTQVNVYEHPQGALLFSIRKPGFFSPKVHVLDASGASLGHFKTKSFSFSGGFWVHDQQGERMAELKGDWKGRNFKFLAVDGTELGTVTQKWAGLGKELFTSADNYMIDIHEMKEGQDLANVLLLAAGLAVDVVYKEGR